MRDVHSIETLDAYLDGELDAAERVAVEAHLALCVECREALAELETEAAALAALPVPDPGPAYWARFASRVEEQLQESKSSDTGRGYERLVAWLFSGGRFAWPRAVGALAVCTLAVYVGLRGVRPTELARDAAGGRSIPESTQGSRSSEALNLPPAAGPNDAVAKPSLDGRAREARLPPSDEVASKLETRADHSPERGVTGWSKSKAAPPLAQPAPSRELEQSVAEAVAVKPQEVRSKVDSAAGAPVASDSEARGVPATSGIAQMAPPAAYDTLVVGDANRSFAQAPPQEGASDLDAQGGRAAPSAPVPSPPATSLSLGNRARVGKQSVATPLQATPPLDSLLAREARVWPHRDAAGSRERLALLAPQLSIYRDDPRACSRARTVLEWLVATSPNDAERDHWRGILGSIPVR